MRGLSADQVRWSRVRAQGLAGGTGPGAAREAWHEEREALFAFLV